MKNILEYYYDIYPDNVFYKNDKYYFEYYYFKYVFEKCDISINELNKIYDMQSNFHESDVLIHKIIINKEKSLITYVNNLPYVLLKIYVNDSKIISLPEICYINNRTIDNYNTNDWVKLWELKNDFIESQIIEAGKKYPNMCKYINYYIGLAENAISYAKNVNYNNVRVCLSHERIASDSTLYELYNPVNMRFDYIVRDICEYVKNCFFNNKDVYSLLNEFLLNNYLSYDEALLLYSRMVYPSYFYDVFDEIVSNNRSEKDIDIIINKSSEYELFLKDLYYYLSYMYNRYFPRIDWIIKRSY